MKPWTHNQILSELTDDELAALIAELSEALTPDDDFLGALLDEYDRRTESKASELDLLRADCKKRMGLAHTRPRTLRLALPAAAVIALVLGSSLLLPRLAARHVIEDPAYYLEAPAPSAAAETAAPAPTPVPASVSAPDPTQTPAPTAVPTAVPTAEPTAAPAPTAVPAPTAKAEPAHSPAAPAAASAPDPTAAPILTPVPTTEPALLADPTESLDNLTPEGNTANDASAPESLDRSEDPTDAAIPDDAAENAISAGAANTGDSSPYIKTNAPALVPSDEPAGSASEEGEAATRTRWVRVGDTWYYLLDDGSMATGWLHTDGAWYYLLDDGAMATGWVRVGDAWYYLREDGSMAADETIDGYTLDASGAWIE